jgi:hypothetical protein
VINREESLIFFTTAGTDLTIMSQYLLPCRLSALVSTLAVKGATMLALDYPRNCGSTTITKASSPPAEAEGLYTGCNTRQTPITACLCEIFPRLATVRTAANCYTVLPPLPRIGPLLR